MPNRQNKTQAPTQNTHPPSMFNIYFNTVFPSSPEREPHPSGFFAQNFCALPISTYSYTYTYIPDLLACLLALLACLLCLLACFACLLACLLASLLSFLID